MARHAQTHENIHLSYYYDYCCRCIYSLYSSLFSNWNFFLSFSPNKREKYLVFFCFRKWQRKRQTTKTAAAAEEKMKRTLNIYFLKTGSAKWRQQHTGYIYCLYIYIYKCTAAASREVKQNKKCRARQKHYRVRRLRGNEWKRAREARGSEAGARAGASRTGKRLTTDRSCFPPL